MKLHILRALKLILASAVILAFAFPVLAQNQIEQSCPPGTTPISATIARNAFTGNLKYNECITASGNLIFPGNVLSYLSPWMDVVAYGADPLGALDSTAAINAAFAAAVPVQGHVFFPCGTFKTTAKVQVVTRFAINITGQSQGCAVLSYQGGATIDSVLQITGNATVPPSTAFYMFGTRIENISIRGNNNVTGAALSVYRPVNGVFRNITLSNGSSANSGCFYGYGGVANDITKVSCDSGNFGGWPSGTGPWFGIELDGASNADQFTTTTLTSPTASAVRGPAIWIKDGGGITVSAAQVSSAGLPLWVGQNSSQITFKNSLFECDQGSGVPCVTGIATADCPFNASNIIGSCIAGKETVSSNTLFSAVSSLTAGIVDIGPSAQVTTFNDATWINDGVNIESGSSGALFEDVVLPSSVFTDLAVDTQIRSPIWDTNGAVLKANFPTYQTKLSLASGTIGCSNCAESVSEIHGTYMASASTPSIIGTGVYATGKAWKLKAIGNLLVVGNPFQQNSNTGIDFEASDANPNITVFGGGVLTFSVNGSGQLQMASNVSSLGFIGNIWFMPMKNKATGTGGPLAQSWNDTVSGFDAQFRRNFTNTGTAETAGQYVLNAGWGTTATVTAPVGFDPDSTITVTSSGTGQAANPTITFTFKDGTWTTIPGCLAVQIGGTGAIADLTTTTESATAPVFTWNGTPVAASTYRITFKCGGR